VAAVHGQVVAGGERGVGLGVGGVDGFGQGGLGGFAQQEKTQARIAHMLKTGKPLRN
jgi:hypothetical protein